MCDLGIQIHGGLGYIESTGASQLYRDARITTIYEGTNGIQAMDLVNRKLSDGGETAHKFLADFENVEKMCINERIFEKGVIDEYTASRRNLKSALNWMLQTNELNERYSGATGN